MQLFLVPLTPSECFFSARRLPREARHDKSDSAQSLLPKSIDIHTNLACLTLIPALKALSLSI